MSKIHVTVELDFPKLDDTASREVARQLVENRGFNVVRTSIPKTAGGRLRLPDHRGRNLRPAVPR